jgi:hypothetical protein
LEAYLLGDINANPLVFLVEIGLVLAIMALDNCNFVESDCGKSAANLLMGACVLKIWH